MHSTEPDECSRCGTAYQAIDTVCPGCGGVISPTGYSTYGATSTPTISAEPKPYHARTTPAPHLPIPGRNGRVLALVVATVFVALIFTGPLSHHQVPLPALLPSPTATLLSNDDPLSSISAPLLSDTPTLVLEPTATTLLVSSSNFGAKTTIVMWTKEGEATLSWLRRAATYFSTAHPDVNIVVVQKDVEAIRQQFPTALASDNPANTPDLLWTVGDHIGVFAPGGLLASVETVFGAGYNDKFLTVAANGARYDGQSWGVPVSSGNELMLLYNKKLLPSPPHDSDQLIQMAKSLTKGSGINAVYGLVYNEAEPFWLNPFLAGFDGWPLSSPDDVVQARGTLNTPQMVSTLQFLSDLKFVDKVMPQEADYNTADQLFKDGRAAMLINGDWAVDSYLTNTVKSHLDLGISPLPMIKATGKYPAPMVSSVYLMVAAPVTQEPDKLTAVKLFTDYLTSKPVQLDFALSNRRLPAILAAARDKAITYDLVLGAEEASIEQGLAQPVVPEMRCAFDAEQSPFKDLMTGKVTPAQAARAMQDRYGVCAKDIQP